MYKDGFLLFGSCPDPSYKVVFLKATLSFKLKPRLGKTLYSTECSSIPLSSNFVSFFYPRAALLVEGSNTLNQYYLLNDH